MLDLCWRKTQARKSHDFIVTPFFRMKRRLQTVFHLQKNETPTFSNSPGLKNVFEKPPFCDVLVWSVDLIVEIKLRF